MIVSGRLGESQSLMQYMQALVSMHCKVNFAWADIKGTLCVLYILTLDHGHFLFCLFVLGIVNSTRIS